MCTYIFYSFLKRTLYIDIGGTQDSELPRGTGQSRNRSRGGGNKDSNIGLQKSNSTVGASGGTGVSNALALQSTMASMKSIDERKKFFSYSSVTNTAKLKNHLKNLDDKDLDGVLNNGYTYPLPGQKPKFVVNSLKSSTGSNVGGGQGGSKLQGNTVPSGLNTNNSGNIKSGKFPSSTVVLGGPSGPGGNRGSTVTGSGSAPIKKKRKRKASAESPKNIFPSLKDPSIMDLT